MAGRVIVVGSVNVDLVVTRRAPARSGRDRHRRAVRAAPRRQGRQPGGGRRAARGADVVHRRRRRRRVRRTRRAPRSRPRASTSRAVVALGRADRRRAHRRRRRGREQHRGGRRRQRGARRPSRSARRSKRLGLDRGDVVLVGHEIRTGATHEALRLGRLAGATTILNPAPATGLERPTLELADILTPNEGELAALVGIGCGRSSLGLGGCSGRSRVLARCWSASAPRAPGW